MPSLALGIVRQLFKIMYVVPYSHLARFSSLVEVTVSSIHPDDEVEPCLRAESLPLHGPRLYLAILQAYSL